MFRPKTKWTMIAKTPVFERSHKRMTLFADKGIITFTIEVFSLHPAYAGFGLFLKQAWTKVVTTFTAQSGYFQFLLHSYIGSPSEICVFVLTTVHRHYTIGHWLSIFCSHCTVLLQASSPTGLSDFK